MNAFKIIGLILLGGVSSALAQKVEFVLPEQHRSSRFHLETRKGNLRIDGIEVDQKVMPGAAICYRVTDQLSVVQVRNFETGGLLLWDSKAKQVRASMIGKSFPVLEPIAQDRLTIRKKEEAGIYGVEPTKMKFVKLGNAKELIGGSGGRLFFLEQAAGHVGSALTVIESGMEPVKRKVDFGEFHPVGTDSVREDTVLLMSDLKGEKQNTQMPPRYDAACWNLVEGKLTLLGEIEGIWVESVGPPPKGGRGEKNSIWFPAIQLRWLPRGRERNPNWHRSEYPDYLVDPKTLEITISKLEASRERK